MKKIFALTAIASGLLISGQSFAAPIFVNIDDFGTGDQSLSDTVTGNGAVSDTNAIRTLSVELLTSTPPVGNTADVVAGILDITNGGGEDSVVKVAWNLAAASLPATATNIGFFFSVLQSDGNPTSLDFTFNSNPLASFSIPGNTANQSLSFGLSAAQLALVSAGGALELAINGAPGWDLSLDAFGYSYDLPTPPPSNVPEPASLALIAAGLAGFGFRKKKQG